MRKKIRSDQTFELKVTDNSLTAHQRNERFDWIKHLPRGEYDMKFLKAYSGLSCHSSIKGCMLRHGCEVKQIPTGNNLIKNIFIWPGYKSTKEVTK